MKDIFNKKSHIKSSMSSSKPVEQATLEHARLSEFLISEDYFQTR